MAVMQGETLIIEGTAVPGAQKNLNNWSVDPSDFQNIADQFNSGKIRLRKDHGDSIDNIIGAVKAGWVKDGQVKFRAEVDDKEVQKKILKGRVEYVSIAGRPSKVVCNVCSKQSKPYRLCNCENAHDVISGTRIKELSAVATPAFGADSDLHPTTFSAAVDKYMNDLSNSEITDEVALTMIGQMDDSLKSTVELFRARNPTVSLPSVIKLLSQIRNSNTQKEAQVQATFVANTLVSSEITKTKKVENMSAGTNTETQVASDNVTAKVCKEHGKSVPCSECDKASVNTQKDEKATHTITAGPDALILLGQVFKDALESKEKTIAALTSALKAYTDAGHGEGVPLPSEKIEDYKKWLKSQEEEKAKKEKEKAEKPLTDDKDAAEKKKKEEEEAALAAKKKKEEEEEEAKAKKAALQASTTVDNTHVADITAQVNAPTTWIKEVEAAAHEKLGWTVKG